VHLLRELRLHGIGRITIGKDRQIGTFGEAADALRVVAVLVSQKNGVDGVERLADRFQ
jgi:hypothetical protein